MYYFLVHLWSLVTRRSNITQHSKGLSNPAVTGMLEMLTATTVAAVRDSQRDSCTSQRDSCTSPSVVHARETVVQARDSCTIQRDSCTSLSVVQARETVVQAFQLYKPEWQWYKPERQLYKPFSCTSFSVVQARGTVVQARETVVQARETVQALLPPCESVVVWTIPMTLCWLLAALR